MIYKGTFEDIEGKEYTVEIQTETGTTTKEITLGGNPFETDMKGEEILYTPIKCQSATIEIVTDTYLPDIYSSKAQGTKVGYQTKPLASGTYTMVNVPFNHVTADGKGLMLNSDIPTDQVHSFTINGIPFLTTSRNRVAGTRKRCRTAPLK